MDVCTESSCLWFMGSCSALMLLSYCLFADLLNVSEFRTKGLRCKDGRACNNHSSDHKSDMESEHPCQKGESI